MVQDIEPDIDAIDERLYELYLNHCHHSGLNPSLKDYFVWLEESYD